MESHIDYSEVYREQELKQLNKRLKKNRLILLACSLFLIISASLFWAIPLKNFSYQNALYYFLLAGVLALLSLFSKKHPYISILASLLICIAFWVGEILLFEVDDILIEGSIQKLFVISLIISRLHTSREAELIRKELHFS